MYSLSRDDEDDEDHPDQTETPEMPEHQETVESEDVLAELDDRDLSVKTVYPDYQENTVKM